MSHDTLDERLKWAVEAARAAGQVTLQYFGQRDLVVDRKADASPVTVADREAELLVCDRIRNDFPDDGWIGEEHGESEGSSGYRWIIDPIDGTKSFICGVPLYSTLVGLEYEDRPVAGVIHLPALGETVFARSGGGAWHIRGTESPRPVQVSSVKRLEDGAFVTSQIDSFEQRGAGGAFAALQDAAWITRTWGDAYGYYLVVTGRAVLMVDPIMSVWDAAAILPILQEAGGCFTDWRGNATIRGGEGVGCNRHVHQQAIELLARYAMRS